MKLFKPAKKWILLTLGFLLALLILKIILLLASKPKVTVNYVFEYNKYSLPQNYDPNDNAALYYQKAFDTFIKASDELSITQWESPAGWPTDFNSSQQTILEQWLTLNSQAFEYFKKAADKRYYWLERYAKEDNSMFSIVLPELFSFREITKALIWDAKVKMVEGQFQSAFEDIIVCYKAGNHKCRTELLLIEQFNGLAIKQNTIQNAFTILDRASFNKEALKLFQDELQAEFDKNTYIPNMDTEKLLLYDALQRTFLDNGKDTGRLSWRMCWDASTGCTDLTSKWPILLHTIWPNLKLRMNCFIGPKRNETAEKIEQIIFISNQMTTKTPWQIKNEECNYLEEIKKINNSNFLLKLPIGINPESIYYLYYNTKVQTKALIAVIAISRFKADIGQFPENLNDLVSKGYLKTIPADPYSDKPLVYSVQGEDFKIYSIGPNFEDDGGNKRTDDIVLWPPWQRQKVVDHNLTVQDANQAGRI